MYFLISLFIEILAPNLDRYYLFWAECTPKVKFVWWNILITATEMYLVVVIVQSDMFLYLKLFGAVLLLDAVTAALNIFQRTVAYHYAALRSGTGLIDSMRTRFTQTSIFGNAGCVAQLVIPSLYIMFVLFS